MKELKQMKIYLLGRSASMCQAWRFAFMDLPSVIIVNDDFAHFMEEHPDVETIVSPANAYGLMDGGYDAAISDYIGWDFQKKVQAYIAEHFRGEQLLGTSFILNVDHLHKKLIHTPTMRIPSTIKDPSIVYQCTRSCLLCALDNDVDSIVIPAFGQGTGGLGEHLVAILMHKAFQQILTKGDYLQIRVD